MEASFMGGEGLGPAGPVATTGRYLVLLDPDRVDSAVASLQDQGGFTVMRTAELSADAAAEELPDEHTLVLDNLGVALVSALPDQLGGLQAAAAGDSPVLSFEPERYVYAFAGDPTAEDPGALSTAVQPHAAPLQPQAFSGAVAPHSADYLRGYRDAVLALTGGAGASGSLATAAAPAVDETQVAWGLTATGAAASRFTGAGVRVAVLDTGIDTTHADFAGRIAAAQSFATGDPSPQDANGHGTHCCGTVCGTATPAQLPRYGVAPDAELYVGKVLGQNGRGGEFDVLAAIEWAGAQGCQVISMSLGGRTQPGEAFSPVFEETARRMLAQGVLIVAASGNFSARDRGMVAPVGRPANSPSIMAVAAVDSAMQIARFSNGGTGDPGAQIDIAGPGVDVRSSWLMPGAYHSISGTSMATPHVAGLAALHAQSDASLRGSELWVRLVQTARRLELPSSDVGAGLAQAP